MKRINHLLFAGLLSVVTVGCNNKTEKAANTTAPLPAGPVRVIAIGRVEPELKITAIGSEVNGVIKKIYVHAGDTVKKGQLLIEFAHDYEDAKLAQVQSKTGSQKAEIENIQAQIAAGRIKSESLKVKSDRLQKILEQGAETRQNADNARAEYDQSVKDLERLQAALHSAESKLNETGADARLATVDAERRRVKAPADGVVLNMDLTEGSVGSIEKPLFDFAPLSPLSVLCEVDELWVNKLKIGQKATIRTQASDEVLAEGEVVYLSPYLKKKSLFSDDSGNMEDRRVREVRIRITKGDALLINSRVEAVIDLTKP